jgi:hypothetical protein
MARPLHEHGHEFGVGITGLNFDPSDLANEEKAKEFIREQTGRTDLRFGKFSWLSYFKWVLAYYYVTTLSPLTSQTEHEDGKQI